MFVAVVMVAVVLVGGFAAAEEKRLHIGNDPQETPQGDDCRDFLKNSLNRADIIRRLNEFVKRDIPRLHLDYSLAITLEKEAWEIWLAGAQNLCPCNNKEADTRIICHCTLKDKPIVVIGSGSDVLILLVHIFASPLPDQDWFLQTKKNQFVNILRSMLTLVM